MQRDNEQTGYMLLKRMDHTTQTHYPWHSGDTFQQSLTTFHEVFAPFPIEAISDARRHHAEEVMKYIHRDLKSQGLVLRFEFTGSSAEGIKVASTDVEFDVMVILPGGQNVKANKMKPLFAKLTLDSKCDVLENITDPSSHQYIMPRRAREFFHGKLQRVINNYPDLKRIVKLSEHGPAVQMNVYKTPGCQTNENVFYTVDMVPCIYIPNGDQYYVGKPIKDSGLSGWTGNPLLAWRRSFSIPERCMIKKIGTTGECQKHCVRILKVLRDKEAGLRHFNSYIIKTAILSMVRDYPDLDWRLWNLGRRFMDFLSYLANSLERGYLPHYFVPGVNLLESFSFPHVANMETRLKELLRSEKQFYQLLESV